ncbi:MAG: FkbM family methyltransferase [Rhodobacteraceae bacterium]|nr:FkbM family methyltransferase [Alphaproteobacteria bacterium]MBT8473875.1 FkbM family methyltransferase [Alphaproteobacteria bacterium]NNK65878.1 FkbM family methyltransferase [Paracoccaceae bacterium]
MERLYISVFRIRSLAKLNRAVLRAALRAHGYNNYASAKESGEEYLITDVLRRINPEVVFDVGANVGKYSEAILRSTNAEVHAFEPIPINLERLREIQNKSNGRLIVNQVGVGDVPGMLELAYNPDATAHASFLNNVNEIPYINNEAMIEVEVTTLDIYAKKHSLTAIDFIKIDTEGFEAEVLTGMSNILSSAPPKMVQIEFNTHQMLRGHSIYTLSQLLPDFKLFQMLPGRLDERNPIDPLSNVYQYSNFVFVRPDICDHVV